MNQGARSVRWRAAVVVVGMVLAIMWAMSRDGEEPYVIRINFGAAPETLEGAEVVIDGEVAGTLKRMGPRTETGFRVGEGNHTLLIRHPDYGSDTARVRTGFGGGNVMLLANFGERYTGNGSETVIVFQ